MKSNTHALFCSLICTSCSRYYSRLATITSSLFPSILYESFSIFYLTKCLLPLSIFLSISFFLSFFLFLSFYLFLCQSHSFFISLPLLFVSLPFPLSLTHSLSLSLFLFLSLPFFISLPLLFVS